MKWSDPCLGHEWYIIHIVAPRQSAEQACVNLYFFGD